LEYPISTHGARKRPADLALKTADAGDTVRNGIWKQAIINRDEEIINLQEWILGRCAAEGRPNPVRPQ
jgi:DNA-directed RNA polymerase beta' subunit